jgi:hypothetical protein
VLSGKTVVSVAAGWLHNLALCSDGTVVAWGYNGYGNLGNGSNTNSLVPLEITNSGILSGKTVTAISAGYFHSLALCSDGTLASWGGNQYGLLGNGNTDSTTTPIAITSSSILLGKTVNAIAAGYYQSLAQCSDGTLVMWGQNDSGQLGDGSTSDSQIPVAVSTAALASGTRFIQTARLATGFTHSLSLVALPPWPIPETLAATALTTTSATLNGSVNANGNATTVLFEYGLTNSYGNSIIAAQSPLNGGVYSEVSANITGLTPGAIYHYRVISTDSSRAAHSADSSFVTVNTNADLASLPTSQGDLTPSFDSATTDYKLTVPSGVSELQLLPEATDTTATVSINGSIVDYSGGWPTVSLPFGSNIITILVTAEDGFTTKTYILIVTNNSYYNSAGQVPLTVDHLQATGNVVDILPLGYTPASGTNFTVVENTGMSPIIGRYTNLAHGQSVVLSFGGVNYQFVANYYGGTGNDLVLQWANTRLPVKFQIETVRVSQIVIG